MKTDRFDEEFRRKLLGLPAEADSAEVERIQGFVTANKPTLPGWGWGKLLLYGGSSLLLIGSLSYNVIQTYRNTHLQASIDSLAHQSVVQNTPNRAIHRDTVYITRSGSTEGVGATSTPGAGSKTIGDEPVEMVNTTQSEETGRRAILATEHTKSPQSGLVARLSRPAASFPRSTSRSNTPVATAESVVSNQHTEESSQVRAEADSLATTLPIMSSDRLLTDKSKTKTERISKPALTRVERASPNVSLSPETRLKSRRRGKDFEQQLILSIDRTGRLATTHSTKQDQRMESGPPTAGFTSADAKGPDLVISISDFNRQTIPVELLASRQRVLSTQLSVISPSHPLSIPKSELSARATRRPWHLHMPTLSVPNAQYRVGAGLTGGSDQVGGALLGEIRLNRHWSVQTGLQLGYNRGFHYRDEQDFNEHQKENFRQTYAPKLSSSIDIQDIKQVTLLVQVPLQVAYHFSFGRQWGLRLGLGTDLNLWGRSAVSFDYRENSRSSEHELARSNEHVRIVNNLLLTTALERSWRKWQFRAGPFISPQLRSADYKQENLFWGANLQVLHRLGK